MQPDQLIEVLNRWNFWTQEQETGISRKKYLEVMTRFAKTQQIIVITGARRTGKSTLMKQYIKQLIQQGEDPKNCLYVNFEEPRFVDELNLNFLQRLYEVYLEQIKPVKGKCSLFLDEIQLVPGWEKFVRALHEKNKALVFVSGSSAKLLSQEFATVLTGRHVDIMVFPLNFTEFLEFKGVRISSKLDLISQKIKIKRFLQEYLEYGGLPLVVLQQEKDSLLAAYVDDIITKDVAQRHKIKKIDKLKSLTKFYLSNISALASFRNIQRFLGISLDSVERYSYYIQESYLIFLMNKFSYSLKEQEVNPKKVYCIDSGLKNTVSFRFSENIGQLYENTVFLHLLQNKKEVYYWKRKGECDFVIKEGQKITTAIQVTYTLARKEEEIKSLLEALHKFNLQEGIIITSEEEGTEIKEEKTIQYIPLWKWLLT